MWLRSLGPQQCSCIQGLIYNYHFLFTLYIQDYQFCSANASSCYTAVTQETSDCVTSCTGLYADVVFTEDTVLNTRAPFSVSGYHKKLTIHNDKPGQDKERQNLLDLLKKYAAYKTSFVKQIKFDPQLPNLSESTS